MHGIGGRTIAEAKARLPYAEYLAWVGYRNKRGSLNVGMRMEHAGALVATVLANLHRKQGKPALRVIDFMPHQEEEPISLQDAMATWR